MSNGQKIFNDALAALNSRDILAAESLFRDVLRLDKSHVPSLNLLTVVLMSMGRFAEAEGFVSRAVELNRSSDVSFYNYGLILQRLDKPHQALEQLTRALRLSPNVAETWNARGAVFNEVKNYESAISDFDQAIQLNKNYADPHANRGKSLTQLKRYHDAFAAYDKALALKPDLAEAWLGRGSVLVDLGRHEDAFAAYDKALALKPDFAEAWLGRGNAFVDLKRQEDAFAAYGEALAFKPDLAEAWLGRGNVFVDLRRYEDAFAAYDKALALRPDLAEAWVGRGNIFVDLNRCDDAFAAYDKALALKPDLAEAWAGRGNVFVNLKRHDDAFAAYDKASALKPDLADVWVARGNVLVELRRYEDAYAAYDKAVALKPTLAEAWVGRGSVLNVQRAHEKAVIEYSKAQQLNPNRSFLKGIVLHQRMLCCDWDNFDAQLSDIEKDIISNKPSAEPCGWQGLATTEQSLQRCARIYNANRYPASRLEKPNSLFINNATKPKIRIGYLCAELREHATSFLIAGLLENHNKSGFEIFGFDNGWDDGSLMRQRVVDALDTLAPIRHLSTASAVDLIRMSEIDILVNLNGYFGEERTAVFAEKPAPIQVNYLGFPGTLGADYIDYIIADQCVVPPNHRLFYNEKVVYLPWSHQANDSRRTIGQLVPSRVECGLPPNAFVFCCFNNNYKITPSIFDSWMKVLSRIAGAVLWLMADNPTAESNLRKEAVARGIDANRLVFAKRLPLADHLARHRLADLFLDTLPYNAHTTASDALWAGLPVLTRIGDTFAGRVGASLLHAINLPELITHSPEEYEALAVEFAKNRGKLDNIKQKLAKNRLTTPLFNTELFTRHIELAYEAMYQRYRAGLPPDHIQIEAIERY